MQNDGKFSQSDLEFLEDKLWKMIEDQIPGYFAENLLPFESIMRSTEPCDTFADDLAQYAQAVIQASTETWRLSPLLSHLEDCPDCREALQQLLDATSERPAQRTRPDANVEISIFDQHLADEDDSTVRDVLDPRRPMLIGSDFLQHPPSWYYTLETIPGADQTRPGMMLTLLAGENPAAGMIVTLVSFGQILRGKTNDQGQLFFSSVRIPLDAGVQTPLINLRLHIAGLS
ncbi:MAG: hypothetical protein J5I90_02855 [Caldilineales bacterium]|nr:hypothetical protein [Caldilineales bacterium]